MYHRVYHRVFEMLVGFVSLKVAESTQLFSNQNYELLKFLVRGLAMLARPVHRKLCQGRGGSTRRGGGTQHSKRSGETAASVGSVGTSLRQGAAFDDEVTGKVVTFLVDCNGIKLPAAAHRFLHNYEFMKRSSSGG